MNTETAPKGALDGLLVIDLTMMLGGPFAGMMLADQGTRVIKIEPPAGDSARDIGPQLEGGIGRAEGGYGAYFASTGRNKESVVIDLKQEAGKAVLRRLVAKADVIMESFRSGVMERLGLSYEALAAINPRLVYAALRGFGDPRGGQSPYASWPAYDPVAQAMGGIMGITSTVKGGAPTKIGPGVGDIMPAMFLAFGIASACWRAQWTGEGQFVDIAMVDGVLAVCERLVFQYSATGAPPGTEGNHHPLLCPFGLFPARDGHVSIGVPKDEFWGPLMSAMGMAERASDPRYATNPARMERRQEVIDFISEWTAARTKQELIAIFGGTVPFGPVFGADDIFADPHFAARHMLVEVEHPGAHRPLTIANTPIRMSGTPGGVRRRAPLTGEDTDRVLTDFGFAPQEVAALRQSGAVG